MPQNDKALLTRLNQHGVEFVIIGGVCGVLHGVPLVTFDLDVCCPFSPENVRRIEAAVKDLHPCHRLTPDKLPLEFSRELVARLKNLYLQTDLGKLDCLSEVAGIGDYQAVLKCSVAHRTSHGEFRMLSLDALIMAKEAAGRGRDLAAVKVLRAIKEKLTHKAPQEPKD
jgi:hypothetical protein